MCSALWTSKYFCSTWLKSSNTSKKEGFYAKVLPGISALDCLFADLLINPASHGCQMFEATHFLIYNRQFDTKCHLILWQVGIIGLMGHAKSCTVNNSKGIKLLMEHLIQFYPNTHEAIIYEAAQYPSIEPKIQKILLNKLYEANFSPLSTLYIPPISAAKLNEKM